MDEIARPDVEQVGGSLRWEREMHGAAGQHPLFAPDGTAVLFSDGWGRRPAPALRFRRLDIQTGEETAKWACGSPVRCLAQLDDGDLLVATDQRLARLDATSLDERARWDGSVRHATTAAIHDGVAVAGNPVQPTITFVDLRNGAVRRKRHGPTIAILGRNDAPPILVGGSGGGLAIVEPASAAIDPVRSTPPAMAAALAEDEQGVWLIAGVRIVITEHDGGASLRPGEAMSEVQWHPLGSGVPHTVRVPAPVRTIDVGRDALWLTPAAFPGTAQYVVVGSAKGDDWRIWRAPEGADVEAVAPSLGLVLTTTHHPTARTSTLSCHRIAETSIMGPANGLRWSS
jgi:hypothetical protein